MVVREAKLYWVAGFNRQQKIISPGAAEAANLGSAEAAKMPLSHKEGSAARSSKITLCRKA
jgi:hypothetical protein